MRLIHGAAILSFTLAFVPATGRAESSNDRAAIRDVITRQMEAFQHDDAATAYSFASPSIQRQMGTPERFLGLVRDHYKPVYRPSSTVFGGLVAEDGQIIQPVDVVGPDGRGARALYHMEQEPDGTWRISGCELTASDALAT